MLKNITIHILDPNYRLIKRINKIPAWKLKKILSAQMFTRNLEYIFDKVYQTVTLTFPNVKIWYKNSKKQ